MAVEVDFVTDDGQRRCWWCGTDPLYVRYHDEEWGMPMGDDRRLFEKICLEGFQAGLSWLTILRKRESFRSAFDDFRFERVAKFDSSKVQQLLGDASIVRHRGKIESTINNAQRAIEAIEEFGSLANLLWSFEPKNHKSPTTKSHTVAVTNESTHLSKSLKKRGWSFVGPTTCYALMQATGMVNDHLRGCKNWQAVNDSRKSFERP